MNHNTNTGKEIIKTLGTSPYILWRYLKDRNFVTPSMKELEQHFGRNQRTIRTWIKKLEKHGYISDSA